MSKTLAEFVDDCETIHQLLEEVYQGDEIAGMLREALDTTDMSPLDQPTSATSPSSAVSAHGYEVEDLLPAGRKKRAHFCKRPIEEGAEIVLKILFEHAGDWLVPRAYCEQHYQDLPERRYYLGLICRFVQPLHEFGLVKRRVSSRRGVTYEYQFPTRTSDDLRAWVRAAVSALRCHRDGVGTGPTDSDRAALLVL